MRTYFSFNRVNGEGDAATDRKTEVSADAFTLGGRILLARNNVQIDDGYASVKTVLDRTTSVVDHSFSLGGVGGGRSWVLRTAPGIDSVVRDAWRVLYIAILARVFKIDLSQCMAMPARLNAADVAGLGRAAHPTQLHAAILMVMRANHRLGDPNYIRAGDVIYLPATERLEGKTVRVDYGMTLSTLVAQHYFRQQVSRTHYRGR